MIFIPSTTCIPVSLILVDLKIQKHTASYCSSQEKAAPPLLQPEDWSKDVEECRTLRRCTREVVKVLKFCRIHERIATRRAFTAGG